MMTKIMSTFQKIDDHVVTSPLIDLIVARDLIERNKKLLKDYPSLEDALNLLESVISRESKL